jgi:hypothetical protein
MEAGIMALNDAAAAVYRPRGQFGLPVPAPVG